MLTYDVGGTFQGRHDEMTKSEQLFRQLVNTVRHGLQECDTEGVVTFSNPAHAMMHGYEEGVLVGKLIWDLLADESEREKLREQLAYLVTEQPTPTPYITRNRTKDGGAIDVQVDWSYKRDEAGQVTGFISVITDITERKRMEQALRKSEERYALALDSTSEGLWDWNISSGELYYSPEWCKTLGYDPGDVEHHGNFWESLVHPEDMSRFTEDLNAHFQGKTETFECEVRLRSKSGEYRWILDRGKVVTRGEDGKPLRMVGVDADITARKRAEEALRASETKSRALLEGSPVCNKIIDLDSKLQYMSAAGRIQLKIADIEPFYGCSFPPELYPESFRQPVIECLERAKAGEISNMECPVHDTEGHVVWFDTTFVPARDKEGQVEYVIVTSVDITERKKAEEDRQRLQYELAHMGRLSTVSEMAATLAHEINQPLGAIANYANGSLDLLGSVDADTTDLRVALGHISRLTHRAGEIIGRVRQLIRDDKSVWSSVYPNDLIREVDDLVAFEAQSRSVRIALDLADELPEVLVDRVQIQQVLVNLVRNAFDAMDQMDQRKNTLTLQSCFGPDETIKINVSDEGTGIPDGNLEKCFEPFFSTKVDGLGLGLGISRSIIEAHGGRLWAESNMDGTTFRFTLPPKD